MLGVRSALAGCALVLAGVAPAASADAEPHHPVVVSEDAADFTPTLEPDSVQPRPTTYAIARSEDAILLGGAFEKVRDAGGTVVSRKNLVAFDPHTGEVDTLAAHVNRTIFALEVDGSSLYVGGAFTSVDGVARTGIAKLDLGTGLIDPLFDARLSSGRVTEIELVNGRLIVGGTFPQSLLALDPATGRDTGYLHLPIEGSVSPSDAVPTGVYRFSVNPGNTRLVAVGNFTSVGGQRRPRAFVLDLLTNRAVVDPWYYRPLGRRCKTTNPVKYPYLRDVDFSPNGRWFVLVSTGFVPRYDVQIGTSVCDAAARFEIADKAPTAPTWINYTGGDTLHSVEVTRAATYVQGHNRWLDNPYGADSAGPGSVVRRGLGAIDNWTGKALAWNPDKPAAEGGWTFLVTAEGLWVGSDSAHVGGEYHRGVAFFPLPTP